MASDAILRTYGDVSAKEDVVLNAIEILTARIFGSLKALLIRGNLKRQPLASKV